MVRGDLVNDLPALAAQAPAGATLVVFHTSVMFYVPPLARHAARLDPAARAGDHLVRLTTGAEPDPAPSSVDPGRPGAGRTSRGGVDRTCMVPSVATSATGRTGSIVIEWRRLGRWSEPRADPG
jgi:hypothetical protein